MKRWNVALPATTAINVNSAFLSLCPCHPCRGPVLFVQAHAHGQEEQEKKQDGEDPGGIHRDGHGPIQVGQTSGEGVGHMQTGRSPHFLQLPSPTDIEGDDDPH